MSLEYHLDPGGVARILACIDHLSASGTLSPNATIGEESAWAWPRGVDAEEFRARFVDELRRPDVGYGDVFIRYAD